MMLSRLSTSAIEVQVVHGIEKIYDFGNSALAV